jgi:hypothetical protein
MACTRTLSTTFANPPEDAALRGVAIVGDAALRGVAILGDAATRGVAIEDCCRSFSSPFENSKWTEVKRAWQSSLVQWT